MACPQFFTIIGLFLNTIASVIMLIPYLDSTKNIEDDVISKMDMVSGNYTQKKHEKDKKMGILGFGLFLVGFILQILGVLMF